MSNVVFHSNVTEKFGAPWTPFAVRGVAGWYDAADPASVVQSGGLVSQWDDKSGNDHHAIQGSSFYQFEYLADPQGRRAMRLGNSRHMDANSLTQDANTFFEAYVVVRLDSFTNFQVFRFDAGTSSSDATFLRGSSDFEVQQTAFAGDMVFSTQAFLGSQYGSAPAAGAPSIFVMGRDVLSANGFLGPFIGYPPLPVESGDYQTFRIGGFLAAGGYLYELIFFGVPGGAGFTTRQKIEGYLAHKWGLTGNLPAGHPYKTEAP